MVVVAKGNPLISSHFLGQAHRPNPDFDRFYHPAAHLLPNNIHYLSYLS